MKKIYPLFEQYIAYILLVSLLLQSCGGGFNNPLIPTREKQIASIQTDAQAIPLPTDIQPLIDKQLTAQGGHRVTIYEEVNGEIKASVEVVDEKDKVYNEVPIDIEEDTDLRSLLYKPKKVQEGRIHVQLTQGKQPAKVVIYKGAGLMGGMEAKKGEKQKEYYVTPVETQENVNKARKALSLDTTFKKDLLKALPEGYTLGAAYDDGDCFFDALAQCVNRINQTDVNTAKYLRLLCHEFYQENKVVVDSWNQSDYGGIDQGKDEYYMVQYTAEECERDFCSRSPIWGRPDVEGVILCRQLNFEKICIIEINKVSDINNPPFIFQLITKDSCTTIDIDDVPELFKNSNTPTLVVEKECQHFVPLLKSEYMDMEGLREKVDLMHIVDSCEKGEKEYKNKRTYSDLTLNNEMYSPQKSKKIAPSTSQRENTKKDKGKEKEEVEEKTTSYDNLKGDPKATANFMMGKVYYEEGKHEKAEKYFKKAKKAGHQEATQYLAKLKEAGHNIDEVINIPNAKPKNVDEVSQVLANEIAATKDQIESDSKGETADSSQLKEKLGQLQEASRLIKNRNPVNMEESPEQMDLGSEHPVNEVHSRGLAIGASSDVSSSSDASLNQPTIINEESNILSDISDLKKEIEEIGKKFPRCARHTKNPLCLLIGNTKSGKSALAHWLNNKTLSGKKDPHNDNAYIFEDTGEISGGIISKTTEPQLVADTYVDCPGFNDTRETLQEIKNALYIQAALRNYKYIKFCLLMPADTFKSGNIGGKGVIEALRNFQKMVKNPHELTNAFSLIVTQHNEKSDPTLENIRALLKLLSTNTAYENQKNLLQVLYEHENRIALFSAPSGPGEYQNNTEKDILLKTIHNTSPLLLKAKDICVSLSSSAQRDLDGMLQYLTKKMIKLLKQVAEEIHSHYQEKIRGFKGLIDGLVKNSMQHYTPIALIKWAVGGGAVGVIAGAGTTGGAITSATAAGGATIIGTAGAGITSITAATAGGATIIGTAGAGITSIKAVMAAGAITSATGAGGAGITAAAAGASLISIGVPVVIIGGIGGIGGTILYKIKNNSWKRKLTGEFQQTEVEKIKLSLRACAKALRKMRSDGVAGNCLKEIGCLSMSTLSEIKTNFDLLSCLYQINGDHNRIRFAQEIWDPTFSRLESTLRYYARESGKFYEEDILKRLDPPSKLKFSSVDFEEDFKVLMEKIKANSKVSHISEDFIKDLLTNYLEEPYTEQDFSLTESYLSQEELKGLKDYMDLCKHIYTSQATPRIVENCGLTLKKKLIALESNKTTIKDYLQALSGLWKNKLGVSSQSPKQVLPSTRYTQGGEAPALPVDQQLPGLESQYNALLQEINLFLKRVGKKLIPYEGLEGLSSAKEELEKIELAINHEYSFYFSNKNGQGVYLKGIKAPLTNHGIVAVSFLSAAGVLSDKNKKITVLDVGFRNQDNLNGISRIIEKPVSMVKDNPVARFADDGEVDYIAYIEEDLTGRKEDKLIIVYSGSNSTKDWVTNFTLGHQDFLGLSIHDGISQWINKSEFDSKHNTLIGEVSEYYKYHRKPRKFEVITMGHSLGGALALLTAYYYKKYADDLFKRAEVNMGEISVKTFTFGAPPFVNKISKETIEGILGKKNIFRVWNFDDRIVSLVKNIIFNFLQRGCVHVGRSFPLYNINNHPYNLLDNFFINMGPHQLDRYISYVETLTPNHPSGSREELTAILKKHIEMLYLYRRLDSRLNKNNHSSEVESKQPEEIAQIKGANKGIPNLGGTCYLNAVTQILASFYVDALQQKANDSLGETAIELINSIKSKEKDSTLKGKARSFLQALRKPGDQEGINWHGTETTEEDPSELLVKIFNWLGISRPEHPAHICYKFTNPETGEERINDSDNPWGPIWQLPLPKKLQKETITMQDCFDESLAAEHLEGETAFVWTEGEPPVRAKKETFLKGLDQIYQRTLVIHLKRFETNLIKGQQTYSKINTKIHNPLNFSIKEGQTTDLGQDSHYQLVGFITHSGGESIHTGHYTAHIKVGDNWFLYNDKIVSEVSDTKVEKDAEEAYIYIYRPI